MLCFARPLRRPAVLLAGLYLAGVGLLARTLPPRPFAEFRVRLDPDQKYALLGISPDGRMLATRQSYRPMHCNDKFDLTEPNAIWLWDLDTTVRGGTPAPVVALDAPFLRGSPGWIDRHPGWQRLFWEIALASDPHGQKVRLLGQGGSDLGYVWPSADGRWLVRFGLPDPPATGPPEPGPVYFVLDRGTHVCSLRLPPGEQPVGVRTDAVLVTAEYGEKDAPVTVRRRSLADGRELKRLTLDGATAIPDEQPLDGPWLIAGRGEAYVCLGLMLLDQWVFDAETGERRWELPGGRVGRWAGQGHTLIRAADHHLFSDLSGELQFLEVESGQQTGTYGTHTCKIEALSPDGEIVAVRTYRGGDGSFSRWPWVGVWLDRCGLRAAAESYEWTLLDARTGGLRAQLPGGDSYGYLPHAVFSADGRRFVVIGDDYTVRVWDLPIRRPWGLALSFAAVPPVVLGLLLWTARRFRRGAARSPLPSAA